MDAATIHFRSALNAGFTMLAHGYTRHDADLPTMLILAELLWQAEKEAEGW